MSGVFQFVPFDIRAANPKCAVAYLFPDKVPAEMISNLKLMMQTSWFLQTRAAAAHVDNMREGWIMVEDFKNVSFGQIMRLASDSRRNKTQMDSMQDRIPGRFRCFYLTNAPLWIRIPMKLMLVFAKARLREKFVLASPAEVAERLGGTHLVPSSILDAGSMPNFHPQQILTMFPELADADIPVQGDMPVPAKDNKQ